jgi:hypothetical protein
VEDGLNLRGPSRKAKYSLATDSEPSSASLCCPGDGVDGAVWLAACFLPEGRELSHAARFEGGAREAEANATARALLVKRGPPAGAGEDRTLEVVLARR